MIKIYIDSRVRVIAASGAPLFAKLRELLTHKNPKFFLQERMGFSTHNIPREIELFTESYNPPLHTIEIPRGEINRLLPLLAQERYEIFDNTFCRPPGIEYSYQYVNECFDLDAHQKRALAAIGSRKQGIIHAATSAGKSAIIMAAIAQKSVKTLIIVHRAILQKQLKEDAEKWMKDEKGNPLRVELLHGGVKEYKEADIYIGIDKTVKKLIENDPDNMFPFDLGMVIMDEVHLAAAPTIQYIMDHMPAQYRYGLTGTLKRKDKMEFMVNAAFGYVLAEITKDELLEMGRVSPVELLVHDSDTIAPEEYLELPAAQSWYEINTVIHGSRPRNEMIMRILNDIRRARPDSKVLVISRYVEPCYRLNEMYSGDSVILNGKESRKENEQAFEDLKTGKVNVMFATVGCVSTGVSIDDLTDVILISPMHSNEALLHQIRGRLMRKAPGKEKGYFHYIFDPYIFPHTARKRVERIVNN